MDIERVIAALAPVDVLGRAPVEIADVAYDARGATPAWLAELREKLWSLIAQKCERSRAE